MQSTGQKKQQPPKPQQVTTAVTLIYASIAFNFLFTVVLAISNWQGWTSTYANPLTLIRTGFFYLVGIYIANRVGAGRNWARFLVGFELILTLFNGGLDIRFYTDYPLPASLFAISIILRLSALFLLFRGPANAWFKAVKEWDLSQIESSRQAADNDSDQPAAVIVEGNVASDLDAQGEPTAKLVATAAAFGAVIGFLNAVFWTVTLPPQSDAERQLILFLILSGVILGTAMGGLTGYLLLQYARRNPPKDPSRWALAGGALGGLFSFGTCFLSTALSLL